MWQESGGGGGKVKCDTLWQRGFNLQIFTFSEYVFILHELIYLSFCIEAWLLLNPSLLFKWDQIKIVSKSFKDNNA